MTVGMCMAAGVAGAECSLRQQHQASQPGCDADAPLKGRDNLAKAAQLQAPLRLLCAGDLPCRAGCTWQQWPDMALWHFWQVLRSSLWHQQSPSSDFPQRTGMSSGKHTVRAGIVAGLWQQLINGSGVQ